MSSVKIADQLVIDTQLALSDFRALQHELHTIKAACKEALETRGTNAELFAKYSLANEANELLIAQNSQMNAEVSAVKAEFDALAKALNKDKEKLEQSIISTRAISDRNNRLTVEKAKTEEHVLNLVNELAASKAQANQLKHDLEIAHSRYQIADYSEVSAMSDLRRSISDFRTTELEKNKSLASVEQRALYAEREAFAAKSEISGVRKSLEISDREVADLRELLNKQTGAIKNFENCQQNLNQQISALKAENENLATQAEAKTTALAAKVAEIENFKRVLVDEDRLKHAAIERMTATVKDVETSITQRMESRLQEISAHNEELIRETAEAKSRADVLQRELENTQRRSDILISGLRKENQRLVFELETPTLGNSSLQNYYSCVKVIVE